MDWRRHSPRKVTTCTSTRPMWTGTEYCRFLLIGQRGLMVSLFGILRPVSAAACIVRRGCGRRCMRTLQSFDIVHLHSVFLWPTSAAAQAARKAGVPYVLSPRGMLVEDLIRRKSSLAKRAWIALFERRNIEAGRSCPSDIGDRSVGTESARLSSCALGGCCQWHRDADVIYLTVILTRLECVAPMCCFWAA